MAKRAKKKNTLPSGSCRIQVYDYTDLDGKKHYKSFTAPTRKLAQMAATEWREQKAQNRKTPENLTVYEAAGRYIDLKNHVLSPATLRAYISIRSNHLKGAFGATKLPELNSATVQLWISEMAANLSPKTVRNNLGLLLATMTLFAPDLSIHVTLPAKERPQLYCPNDEDIKQLLTAIEGTPLELAVLLAAFGPLRRAEICALESSDLKGNTITVSKDMVKTPDNLWIIKNHPKTDASYRTVELPPFVVEKLRGKRGRLIQKNPNQITYAFSRTVKKLNTPYFRFHDLRHYAASIMHAIGIPDQYILQRGGWSSDNVMKTVYRNVIDLEAARQNKKINEHFKQVKMV